MNHNSYNKESGYGIILAIIFVVIFMITISNSNNSKENKYTSNISDNKIKVDYNILNDVKSENESNSLKNYNSSSNDGVDSVNENNSDKNVAEIQESKSSYISSCMNYNSQYNDMQRNPNSYKGKRMKFYGYVDSRWARDESMYAFTISASTDDNRYVGMVYCKIDSSVLNGGNLLQWDYVDVYGEFVGLSTNLKTIYGTLDYPTLEVKYVDLNPNR